MIPAKSRCAVRTGANLADRHSLKATLVAAYLWVVKLYASPLGTTSVQPVTVKVADATVPLWRPLAKKVSFLPG
jgi:hypothetical protein